MPNMDLNSEKEEGCAGITPFRIKSQIGSVAAARLKTAKPVKLSWK